MSISAVSSSTTKVAVAVLWLSLLFLLQHSTSTCAFLASRQHHGRIKCSNHIERILPLVQTVLCTSAKDDDGTKTPKPPTALPTVLETKLAVLEDVVRQMKAERTKLLAEIDQSKAKVDDIRKQSEAALGEKEAEWKRNQASLEGQVESQTKELAKLAKETDRRQSAWLVQEGTFKEEIKEQAAIIRKLKEQVKDLDVSVSDAAQEIVVLRQESNNREMELQADIEKERRNHASLEKDLDRLQEKEGRLLAEAHNMTRTHKESIQIASAAVEAAEARERLATEETKKIEMELYALKAVMKQQEEQVKQALADKKSLQQALDDERAKVQSMTVTASIHKKEEQTLREQLQNYQDELTLIRHEQSQTKEKRLGLWGRMKKRFSRGRKS